MAISITPNITTVNAADNTTNWTGAGGANTDLQLEGSGCIYVKASNTTSAVVKYDQAPSGTDMSGQHFYVWMFTFSSVDTIAAGGMRIYAEDTAGEWAEWYVGGSENYGGGWQRFVAYADATPSAKSTGTYNSSIHQYLGFRMKTTSKFAGAGGNCFCDIMSYGSGITVESGASDAITWDDIATTDATSSYGVVVKKNGIYVVQGKVIFGDTAGANSVDIADTNSVVVFPENDHVASTFYGLQVSGDSGTTNFKLGTLAGASGIAGGTYIGQDATALPTFTSTDPDNDKVQIYGATFLSFGVISFPVKSTVADANREVRGCTFSGCGQIDPDTIFFENNTIADPTNRGLLIDSTTHNVKDCTFVGVDAAEDATHINAAGTYTYSNMKFIGGGASGPYHLENSSAGLVTIEATNGSDINSTYTENTGGGTIAVNNSVDITITVVDGAGDAVGTAQCAVYQTSDDTQLMNEDTTGAGVATQPFNYASDTAIYYRVRKGSASATKYIPVSGTGTIDENGFSATVTLLEDSNNAT